jgi:hypothetical protein
MRKIQLLLVLCLSILLLFSCAKPTVVNITQPGDKDLNCEMLKSEIAEVKKLKEDANSAKEGTGGNVARMMVFWPAWARSLHNADVAIQAANDRKFHLVKIMKSKKCKGAGNIDNENIAPAYSSETIAGQLKILQEMYYNGELTKEEYEKAKSKALD